MSWRSCIPTYDRGYFTAWVWIDRLGWMLIGVLVGWLVWAPVVLAALSWSPGCLAIGELYEKAAQLRDTGMELEKALKGTPAKRIQLALRHVYGEPDMTAQAWKWFATGICVEQEGKEKERRSAI